MQYGRVSAQGPGPTDVIFALRVPPAPSGVIGWMGMGARAMVGAGVAVAEGVVSAVSRVVAPPTGALLDATVPVVSDAVVRRLDLRAIVTRALDEIDLTAVVVDRVDLPAVINSALDEIDLTALVVQRVDLGTIVGAALDELDLTEIVMIRTDLKAIVTRALDELDLTEIVLTRADLKAIITRALDELDLTDIVLDRVDLARVVDGALDELDLTQLVVDRVDIDTIVNHVDMVTVVDKVPVVDIANYVIEEIDLPRIIRTSTGGVAADAMDTARLQAHQVDKVSERIVDRIIFRKKRNLDAPGEPQSLAALAEEETPPQ